MASWFETHGVAVLLTMRVSDLILRRREAPSRRMKPLCSNLLQAPPHDPRDQSPRAASLDARSRRYHRARFRRSAPAADGDDGDARAGISARSGERSGAARRRRADAGGRQADRGGRSRRALDRDQGRRSAASGSHRLASRQPPFADTDHAQGPAHPPGSRHRGDGSGIGRAHYRDRGAVRSRGRCICAGGS
jgi:hypothetical protein